MLLTTPTPGRLLDDDPLARASRCAFRCSPRREVRGGPAPHALRRRRCRAGRVARRRKRDARAGGARAAKRSRCARTVVRWFFESVEGKSPQESWATRETLDEGLETVKTLVRDWIVASGHDGVALVSLDHADRLRTLQAAATGARPSRCSRSSTRRNVSRAPTSAPR